MKNLAVMWGFMSSDVGLTYYGQTVKNLPTPSSIFIFVFSSFTGELCSQPNRGNDRRLGRMFPEHVERSLLNPEYSFDEYFQLGSRRNIRPIKKGLYTPNLTFARWSLLQAPCQFYREVCLTCPVLNWMENPSCNAALVSVRGLWYTIDPC